MAEVITLEQQMAAACPFETWYSRLQENFPESHALGEDVETWVSSQLNESEPIHRWYTLKESFSWYLPVWIVQWMKSHYNHNPVSVLEPFLGSGTTGISLSLAGIDVCGVEYNPFIRFVATAKAGIPLVDPEILASSIQLVDSRISTDQNLPIPALTTLHKDAYIKAEDLQLLLSACFWTSKLEASNQVRNLIFLGLSSAIESAFNLRKDGRALRYIKKPDKKGIREELRCRWQEILDDVQQYHEIRGCSSKRPLYTVFAGSSTNLMKLRTINGFDTTLKDKCFDTVIYSPPYLNNFDYSEIYKLELWLLGFLENYEEWKSLRMGTVRSHHSIVFPETRYLALDPRTVDIASVLRDMGSSPCLPNTERERIKRVIDGYFDDMFMALQEQWRVLKPGGILAYVVANSRHYYLPIATDLILGEIAHRVGFEPLDLVVLRKRNGRTRQKLFLRESVVFMQKPLSSQNKARNVNYIVSV